jgi:hypothetical protein
LKLFVLPLRRRSEMVRRHPHRFLSKGVQALLPCENDQAKPDHISRLARSTNLSKILESLPPERGPWDRGPDFYIQVSSNLVRPANFCTRLYVWLHSSPFLRELFKTIEVRPPSQALSLFRL